MTNHLVDGGADGLGKAMVIEWCRNSLLGINDIVVADSVQFTGTDAGLYGRRDHFQYFGG